MAWYWWVLIGIGVAVIGYVKIKVFTRIMNRARKDRPEEEEM